MVHALRPEFTEYPSTISIETKAHCNAACSFCPYTTLSRKGTELSDEIIQKICDEISRFPKNRKLNIVLARINETFLDKRWLDISNKLLEAKNNITFGFFSNGSTLTEKNISKLISLANVQYLNVSLNYADPNEHKINMNLDFKKILRNLDTLHEQVISGKFKPLVVVSRVASGDDRDDDFSRFVSDRYPEFRLKIASKSNWLGNIEVENSFDIPTAPCRQWFQLHILADGKQAFCCIDSKGEYGYGNIKDNSLLEMYNHPDLMKLRTVLPPKNNQSVCYNSAYYFLRMMTLTIPFQIYLISV